MGDIEVDLDEPEAAEPTVEFVDESSGREIVEKLREQIQHLQDSQPLR